MTLRKLPGVGEEEEGAHGERDGEGRSGLCQREVCVPP